MHWVSHAYNPVMLYFDAVAIAAAIPPLEEQLRLAEQALVAVGVDGDVPGKISVHPRPHSSIAYAMPAFLPSFGGGPGSAVGIKWVTIFPGNSGLGLPTVNSVILLSDPETLAPAAIMDGSTITAARTAAVSGVAVARLAPACGDRPLRIALIGAGVQGRSHVPMLGYVAPGHWLSIYDRHPDRSEVLAAVAAARPDVGRASAAETAEEAVDGADVVITAASFGDIRQIMTNRWLRPEALVVAVDYETYVSSEVARSAGTFLVDEVQGFLNSRAEGRFEGFPDPSGTIGSYIRSGEPRPSGRVLVIHLGMGLSDIVFAAAVFGRAREKGLGMELS